MVTIFSCLSIKNLQNQAIKVQKTEKDERKKGQFF